MCDMGYYQCITILAIYVDDIVITGDDVEEIKILKERLGRAFEVKEIKKLLDHRRALSFPIGNMFLIYWLKQGCSDVIHMDHLLIEITKLVPIQEIR
jgi:hypothetical protein